MTDSVKDVLGKMFLKDEEGLSSEITEEVTEFDNADDWVLSMILVALMHINPGLNPDDAIKKGKEWVHKLYLPRTDYLWRKQAIRIKRGGLRAEASRIRRELYKLI